MIFLPPLNRTCVAAGYSCWIARRILPWDSPCERWQPYVFAHFGRRPDPAFITYQVERFKLFVENYDLVQRMVASLETGMVLQSHIAPVQPWSPNPRKARWNRRIGASSSPTTFSTIRSDQTSISRARSSMVLAPQRTCKRVWTLAPARADDRRSVSRSLGGAILVESPALRILLSDYQMINFLSGEFQSPAEAQATNPSKELEHQLLFLQGAHLSPSAGQLRSILHTPNLLLFR